jgi:hypothetical protein
MFDPTLTLEELQALIVSECSVEGDTVVQDNMPVWWRMYTSIGLELQYWSVRRHVLLYSHRLASSKVDITTGNDKIAWSNTAKELWRQLQHAESQISVLSQSDTATASKGFASGIPNNYQSSSR